MAAIWSVICVSYALEKLEACTGYLEDNLTSVYSYCFPTKGHIAKKNAPCFPLLDKGRKSSMFLKWGREKNIFLKKWEWPVMMLHSLGSLFIPWFSVILSLFFISLSRHPVLTERAYFGSNQDSNQIIETWDKWAAWQRVTNEDLLGGIIQITSWQYQSSKNNILTSLRPFGLMAYGKLSR